MKTVSEKRLLLVISLGSVVFILIAMFLFSSQTSDVSSDTSGRVVKFIVRLFNIDDTAHNISMLHTVIRKLAHFSLFMILGVSVSSVVHFSLGRLEILLSPLVCLLAAILDETHQLFISGRSGEIRDVLIDFSGAVFGSVLFLLAVYIVRSIRSRRKPKDI